MSSPSSSTSAATPVSDSPFEHLTVSLDPETLIGRLRLNRPEKLNPLGTDTLDEIAVATRWFDEREARVVIISGAGRAFSAGADLSTFTAGASAGPAAGTGQPPDSWQAAEYGRIMADSIEQMEALAIAAIHGWCVGGGVVLAAACDLRVAARSARFSIPEVDLGIPLAWGGVPRLVREIGPALAKELILTCRPFDSEEAKQAGFLNRVVDDEALDQTAMELAISVAAKARFTVAATKRYVNAVSDQMVGQSRSWADAGGLAHAFRDEECKQVREAYLAAKSTPASS